MGICTNKVTRIITSSRYDVKNHIPRHFIYLFLLVTLVLVLRRRAKQQAGTLGWVLSTTKTKLNLCRLHGFVSIIPTKRSFCHCLENATLMRFPCVASFCSFSQYRLPTQRPCTNCKVIFNIWDNTKDRKRQQPRRARVPRS